MHAYIQVRMQAYVQELVRADLL